MENSKVKEEIAHQLEKDQNRNKRSNMLNQHPE